MVDFELRNEFAISGGIATGQEKFVGFMGRVGNGVEDAFLHASLFATEPIKASHKNGQRGRGGDNGGEEQELNVIAREVSGENITHNLIRIPHIGGKSK